MTTLPPSVTENRHIPNARDSAKLSSTDSLQSHPVASAAKSIPSRQRGSVRRMSKRDRYTAADLDDDMALAKSTVRMPCDDNSQNTSRAAAAATTARTTPNVHTESADNIAEKAQIAALRKVGLLYDDASPRDRRFTLDNISHDEPSYVIRPAKPRARKHGSTGSAASPSLSYLNLGEDESLIKYGLALSMSEADAADASSTLTSPALRAIQEMGDATLESWVVLDNTDA
ncbi:hypothetical protein MY5147_006570 [Beauveria neobassiana]|uniref:Uncharacterized protein n=2 Tax=Beauveria bassiana TaxID=176275 RepID=A0A0A2VRY6_BEABA|nr:hypothetical protein BBAD15_g4296 [Beauveria bassiana D1-5]PQK12086.1 hypothetical protein BB8028_0003g07040 [Beauveria bassiana]